MGTLSNGTISLMLLGVSYSFVLPLLLCGIFKMRFRAHIKPFLVGMLTYGAFSFCLVNIINGLLLRFVDASGLSTVLIFIYSLCVQIIGALIGQVGKYYSLKVLKNDPKPGKYALRGDALEFGAGFGGLELFMTVGITMASYFSYAAILNGGQAQQFLDSLSGVDQESVQSIFNMIQSATASDYISIILQGLGMFLFQIGSSLLVYRAIFGTGSNDKAYFRLAIIFHIIMVVPSCLVKSGIVKTVWFQTIIMVIFGAAVLYYGFDKLKEYEKQRVRDMAAASKGKKTIHLK
ncbi:MAG: YhfC family intramembrane metalloprotease [Clostridiales bacterium]|nr:YhfC family intramembrane metalloprotease [Clostridiales bacterium]